MINSILLNSEQIKPYVEMFHLYGHGIQNGVPEDIHLARVLQECEGLMGMLILKDNEPVALATLVPSIVEDSHFPGAGLICVHLAGANLGFAGMRHLHRALRELGTMLDADWYSMSHRVTQYEYRNRYYMLGDTK